MSNEIFVDAFYGRQLDGLKISVIPSEQPARVGFAAQEGEGAGGQDDKGSPLKLPVYIPGPGGHDAPPFTDPQYNPRQPGGGVPPTNDKPGSQ